MLKETLALDSNKNFWITYTDGNICFTRDNIKNNLGEHF